MKSFNDEKFKAYFLGKLPTTEAEILEEEYAANENYAEQVSAVENELTDDFLRGNLSAEDANLYETNYLITDARQNKLRIAKGLWQIANESQTARYPVAQSSPKSFWQMFTGQSKVFALAFGGLALLIFGGFAFYLLSLKINKNDVAEIKEINQPLKPEVPSVLNSDKPAAENHNSVSANTSAQTPEIIKNDSSSPKVVPETKASSTPKIVKPSSPRFAAFVLSAGTLRGENEQSITIAQNVKTVGLLMSPAGAAGTYKIYRAVLKNAEGETLFTSTNLKALSFSIAAEKLENRTYIVFLEGRNAEDEFESIAEYTFRVRR